MKFILGDLYQYKSFDLDDDMIYWMIGMYKGITDKKANRKSYNFDVVYNYKNLWELDVFSQTEGMISNLTHLGPGSIEDYPELFLWF